MSPTAVDLVSTCQEVFDLPHSTHCTFEHSADPVLAHRFQNVSMALEMMACRLCMHAPANEAWELPLEDFTFCGWLTAAIVNLLRGEYRWRYCCCLSGPRTTKSNFSSSGEPHA